MAISAEAVRAGLKIRFGGKTKNFTIPRLDPEADADSLLLLAEAVSLLQGTAPLELISTCEYRLIKDDNDRKDEIEQEETEQEDTAGSGNGSAGAPIRASISVGEGISVIGRDDIATAEGSSFNLFSDAGFTTEITGTGTIELINSVTTIYIKVTSQDGTFIHYAVKVTRAGSGNGGLLNVAGQNITAYGTAGAPGITRVFIRDTG